MEGGESMVELKFQFCPHMAVSHSSPQCSNTSILNFSSTLLITLPHLMEKYLTFCTNHRPQALHMNLNYRGGPHLSSFSVSFCERIKQ